MLERISQPQYAGVSKPSADAIFIANKLLEDKPNPIFAEVGVGVGATSLELAKLLRGNGELYLFDFEQSVSELADDLRQNGFTNIKAFGNTRKTYDSYTWHLLKLAREHPNGLFDFAYLDGAHSFAHDLGATALLQILVKPDGYLLLDDLRWSFAKSPSMNPEKRPDVVDWFTGEQLEAAHIQMICDALLEPDPQFERMVFDGLISSGRALYKKVSAPMVIP